MKKFTLSRDIHDPIAHAEGIIQSRDAEIAMLRRDLASQSIVEQDLRSRISWLEKVIVCQAIDYTRVKLEQDLRERDDNIRHNRLPNEDEET